MLDLLKKRRSIRRFQERKVEEEKVEALVKAALLSPTSKNRFPWEFIVVDDEKMLETLAQCKPHGAAFLKGAPLAIIVLADPEKSDVWIEDTSIASILIQITAESMGLGSCWIQIRERMYDDSTTAEDYIKKVFEIDENMKIESIIALGYPDETKKPHSESQLQFKKVYRNRYKYSF